MIYFSELNSVMFLYGILLIPDMDSRLCGNDKVLSMSFGVIPAKAGIYAGATSIFQHALTELIIETHASL
ncbi:MAG: hypothetical protein GY794_10310 [bacterium]|nr:hypothetical protein [bacterium]